MRSPASALTEAAALTAAAAAGVLLAATSAGPLLALGAAVAVAVVGAAACGGRERLLARSGDDVLGSLALALLYGAVATMPLNGVRVLPSVALCDVLLVGAGVAQGLRLLLDPRPLHALPAWLPIAAWLLALATLISTIFASQLGANLVPGAQFVVALLLTPIVIATIADRPQRRARLVGCFVAGALVNALVGVLDLAAGTHVGQAVTGLQFTYNHRVAGFTNHPNTLATVCALALPLTLAQLGAARASGGGRARTALALLIVVALVFGVLVSGSRAGLVVAAAAVVVGCVRLRAVRRLVPALLACVALALVAVSVASSTSLFVATQRLGDGQEVASSNEARVSRYGVATQIATSRPLTGVGFATARRAHDIYLQLLQAGGVLALAAFALLAAGALRDAARLGADARLDERERELARALAICMLVWLGIGVVQNPLYDRFLYFTPGLIVALAIVPARRGSRQPAARRRLPSRSAARS